MKFSRLIIFCAFAAAFTVPSAVSNTLDCSRKHYEVARVYAIETCRRIQHSIMMYVDRLLFVMHNVTNNVASAVCSLLRRQNKSEQEIKNPTEDVFDPEEFKRILEEFKKHFEEQLGQEQGYNEEEGETANQKNDEAEASKRHERDEL